MGKIIDGKRISLEIKTELKERVNQLWLNGVIPQLAIIQIGNDAASSIYVSGKTKDCEFVGIDFIHCHFAHDEQISEAILLDLIEELNNDNHVDGIIVQLPLPEGISDEKIVNAICPSKDVDGFSPINIGNMVLGNSSLKCCTPAGIIELLKRSGIEIAGKECVVVGRSNIVGKPVAALLSQEDGTVTLAHSKTKDLKSITSRADILVVAMGVPKFITSEYVKKGAVVVDVGIHRLDDGKMCGDVDFDDVYEKVSAITPVPGGVGLMTRAMLLANCILSAEHRAAKNECKD